MTEYTTALNALDNNKLIDAIKNYKQYGYSESIRNKALEILKSRGIDELELRMTGNLVNDQYELAESYANSYKKNSLIAFWLYLVLFIKMVIIPTAQLNDNIYLTLGAFGFWVINPLCWILYTIFIVRSFNNHINFYKSIGKELGIGDQMIYFVIGMPFYIFMYFFYRSQIKEQQRMIQ